MKASALAALLIGASSLALATRAQAQEVVFADNADLAAAALRGERVTQGSGVTQIRLSSGAMLSFVEGAEFQLRPDGTVDLFKGNVTVTGAGMSETVVRLGGQGTGKISGAGSSGSFSVDTDASGKTRATGRVLTGLASIANGRETKRFNAGQAWEVANGHPRLATSAPVAPAPRITPQRQAQLAAATPAPTPTPTPAPEPQVASISEGGPAAAAQNGVPVVLGEALAAAGASGDIVSSGQRIEAAVANPSLETFPSDDLASLVAYAARLESLYDGRPFNQAQADVIRAYLNYLASGQSQAQFLTVYAGLMVQFLDLVRSGAAPSSFSGTSLTDINAFISYRSRTDGFAALSSQHRVLVDAYIAFILGGGNADQFVARYTSLTQAYFNFIRSGGDPLAFEGATQATLSAYITFLNDSGLLVRLAESDRALLQAYLANGGTAFIQQYRTALTTYFAYLQSGQLPSQYEGADPAALRQYLETLQATGLFEQVLGAQATFYAQYLAYLKQGGTIDGWEGLPANVFAGYTTALEAYYTFLTNGGVPSAYAALTQDEIRQYLAALQAVGANEAFLGQLANFYSAYFTYLAGGGNPDLYTGLPTPNYAAFAEALSAYVAYLQAGGVPSAYTGADLALLQQYIKALIDSGKLSTLLAGQAQFLTAYYAFLASGGTPDGYSALPVYGTYVTALEAYYAFLAGGGKPSEYTALTQAQILAYLKALTDAGVLAALFDGATLTFIQSFYVYLAGGGNPDLFSGLPGSGGGTGGGTGGTRLTTYTGGFPTTDSGVQIIAGNAGNIQPSNGTSRIDSSGALTTAGDIADVSAKVIDLAGDASAIVARLHDGVVKFKNSQFGVSQNGGMPYVALAPWGRPLPTSGTIDYKVLAATRPVYSDGRTAPGTFDAALTIGFSTNNTRLTFRTLGTIVMPEASGDVTYTFSTPNYANGQMQEVVYDSLGNYFFGTGMTGTGQACVSGGTGCSISLYGDFAGAKPEERLGLMYQTYGGAFNAGRLQGAVIFGKEGTLPGDSTGGGTGNPNYAGGFTATTGVAQYAALGSNGGGSFGAQDLTVNADGTFTSTTAAIRAGSAKFTDVGGDSRGLVGRFNDGTVLVRDTATAPYGLNNGASYVLMAPIVGSLPLSGTIKYDIVAATRPVYDDGHTAPGTFTAKFAVGFGTSLTYAIDGAITMADATYTVRAGNPLTGQTVAAQVGSPTFFVVRPALTSTSVCTSGCQLNMFGTFGGANPEQRLGFAYHSIGSPTGKTITGSVLFGQEGTIGSGTSTANAPSGSGLRYLGSGIIYRSANNADQGFVSGSLIYDSATVTLGSDDKPDSALLAPTTTYTRSTATNAEAGGAGGVIGWSRWTGGTVTYTTSAFAPTSGTEQVRSNGGYAQVWGQPLTNKPTSGTATYTMVGATAPVRADGSVVPGSVQDATLAVAFATNRIGYESHLSVGGTSYFITTNGGIATPNVPMTSTGQFSALTNNGSVQLNGFLSGSGASHAGVSYFIGSSSNGIAGVVGLAKAP